MNKIKKLEIDSDVNAFVVGDIHGCYSLLKQKLKEINFNPNTDLLIGVGDLVDRGGENEKCISLLNELWFTTVKGNHEDFCYKGMNDYMVEFYHKMPNNGGKWFYELPDNIKECVGNRLNQLPIMLEVSYCGKKFGFVHADLPVQDWELAKEMLINGDMLNGRSFEDHLLWSRGIIEQGDPVNIAQVDNVFFGHTVLTKVVQLGNCTFLDTGGVFKDEGEPFDLTVVNLKDWT